MKQQLGAFGGLRKWLTRLGGSVGLTFCPNGGGGQKRVGCRMRSQHGNPSSLSTVDARCVPRSYGLRTPGATPNRCVRKGWNRCYDGSHEVDRKA